MDAVKTYYSVFQIECTRFLLTEQKLTASFKSLKFSKIKNNI